MSIAANSENQRAEYMMAAALAAPFVAKLRIKIENGVVTGSDVTSIPSLIQAMLTVVRTFNI